MFRTFKDDTNRFVNLISNLRNSKHVIRIHRALLCLTLCLIFEDFALSQSISDDDKAVEANRLLKAAKSDLAKETMEMALEALRKLERSRNLFREVSNAQGEKSCADEASNAGNQLYRHSVKVLFSPMTDYEAGLRLRMSTVELLKESIVLFDRMNLFAWSAYLYIAVADVDIPIGELDEAVVALDKALQFYRKENMRSAEAATINRKGWVFMNTGEYETAIQHLREALRLYDLEKNEDGRLVALTNLGTVHKYMGKHEDSIPFFLEVLDVWKKRKEPYSVAILSAAVAESYQNLKRYDLAVKYYEGVFPLILSYKGEQGYVSEALNGLGKLHAQLGNYREAIRYYGFQLDTARKASNSNYAGWAFGNLMDVSVSRSAPLAITFGKQSVNSYQKYRTRIRSLPINQQRSYIKSVEHTYRRLANILIREGRIAEAEQVLGMLKEEEYFSYLRRSDAVAADLKSRISLSPDEKKAFEDYEKFAETITQSAAAFGLIDKKRKDLPLGKSLTAADQIQFDELKLRYDSAITVFNKFLDDLKVRFGKNDSRVAGVESDTQGILKRLGEPRTVIISTIVGEDRLDLIVTTSNIQRAHSVAIRADDLNNLVTEFRDAVRNPRSDPRPLGKKFYDILFPRALQQDLINIRADTIVWSLDGTLRYVPMAALWDGEKYLAERYSSAVLTLASRDKLSAASIEVQGGWKAFGVGVSKPFENFSALPAVPRELCSVVNDPRKKAFCNSLGYRNNGVIEGLVLADDEFTLTGFQNNLGKTPVVHIASHFSLNAGNEIDSYLLLGGGAERRFSLDSLKKTRLDNVELLTLSACNTAMTSGNNSSGIEIEGFGALAQKQGARTVLATLWAVADESTSMLMSEFYRLKKTNLRMSKSAAIQAAQKAMIDGRIKASGTLTGCRAETFATGLNKDEFKCDPNAPYSHPYFWSPFVLMGNWT